MKKNILQTLLLDVALILLADNILQLKNSNVLLRWNGWEQCDIEAIKGLYSSPRKPAGIIPSMCL